MILAIDIGNTHMVLGCLDEKNDVITRFQMSTDRLETAYEYAAEISQILQLEQVHCTSFAGAVISSVVPSLTPVIQKAVTMLTHKDPLILGKNAKINLELDMNGLPPEAIAGDLLATSIAAKVYYTMPAIIIDIGTATTVTVMDKRAVYRGGCILPGPGTSVKSLVEMTSLLPAIDFTAPDQAIARDTVRAMQSGIMYGSAGALDGIIDHFEDELGEPVETFLVTGGMASIIGPLCRHPLTLDQNLLMRGLGLIYQDSISCI